MKLFLIFALCATPIIAGPLMLPGYGDEDDNTLQMIDSVLKMLPLGPQVKQFISPLGDSSIAQNLLSQFLPKPPGLTNVFRRLTTPENIGRQISIMRNLMQLVDDLTKLLVDITSDRE